MFRNCCWLFVVFALIGCGHAIDAAPNARESGRPTKRGSDTQLTGALLAGDEVRVRKLTDEIMTKRRSVSKAELTDDRAIPPNVLLRATYENRDYQLGVKTVSDYSLCLLQIQNHTSSENILRIVAPVLHQQCSEAKHCEVCNSQAFPVRTEVKERLIEYWLSKLN